MKTPMQKIHEAIDKLILSARYGSTFEEKKARMELLILIRKHVREE